MINEGEIQFFQVDPLSDNFDSKTAGLVFGYYPEGASNPTFVYIADAMVAKNV